MRTIKISLLLFVFITLFSTINSINAQVPADQDKNSIINVYYFHFTTRCETCIAVENETKYAIEELFNDKIIFSAYNLDIEEDEAFGKSIEVYSQSLIILKGEEKIDLTNEAFLYALPEPEKFKKIIQDNISSLL